MIDLRAPAPRAGVWVAFVAVAALAYSAGRWWEPQQAEAQIVTLTKFKDRIVEKRVESASKSRERIVYRERETRPDGTKIERETERALTLAKSSVNASTETERSGSTLTESKSSVTDRPQWRVSVQAGAALRAPAVDLAGPLVIGAQIDRRILGGVSVGLWANTVGAGGVAVSAEF
jgi:hypothetical protein